MLSRVANSIYWMTRYVERTESLARFIDVTLNVMLDQPGDSEGQWAPLIHATGDEEIFLKRYGAYTPDNVRHFLTFDRQYPNSILSSLSSARENARTVREAISSEAWEVLNEYYLMIKNAASDRSYTSDVEFYTQVKRFGHLLDGVLDSTMSQDKAWHFANLGRYLERADKTSRILDVKYFTLLPSPSDVDTTLDDLMWSAVLRSVDGFEMFRKRYHSLTIQRVVEFLVLDKEFPRSIHFCVRAASNALARVGGPVPEVENQAIRLVRDCQDLLESSDAQTIINNGLHEFIDMLQKDFNLLGAAINDAYFSRKRDKLNASQRQSQTQSS